MIFKHALGQTIRDTRLSRGLNMRDVSVGGFVSLGHLSEVERGVKEASSEIMEGIARGLGVETSQLIIEAGYRMATNNVEIPTTPESLFGDVFIPVHSPVA